MARPQPLCLFLVYSDRTVYEHWISFFSTLNRQLEDNEELFAEFDVKCIGLESQAEP